MRSIARWSDGWEERVLVWSSGGRAVVWLIFAVIFGVVYLAPMAMIGLASLAGQWNGVLPSHMTLANYAAAFTGDSGTALRVSVITGVVASLLALISGTWAALALRNLAAVPRQVLEVLFFLPSAVPSVSVGLGLLVAFSRPPVLLNGTTAIVIIAHFVLISAFTFGNVSAGLSRLPSDFEQVAASLGAKPAYRLWRVTLPMLQPYLIAACSLSFALSMGELGATVMVYPPGWVTLPVGIFGLSDRGDVFEAAALTVILAFATLLVLVGLSRVPTRAEAR
jgi:2-aminoethylphosphonate transport system permease protein